MTPYYDLHLDEKTYRDHPALNASHLKLISKPFMYKQMVIEGKSKEKTDSLSLGTAVHIHILEPHKKHLIKNLSDYGHDDKRKWQQIRELERQNPDCTFFTAKEIEKINAMVTSVKLHDEALKLYASGAWNEVSLFWEMNGKQCKGRCDTVNFEENIVIDLKTTKDAEGFMKECVDYTYHLQAAFYLKGLKAITGKDFTWYWVAVDSEAPHFTFVYKATSETIEIGNILLNQYMQKLLLCEHTNSWPIGNESILEGQLPSWYTSRFKKGEEYNEFRVT